MMPIEVSIALQAWLYKSCKDYGGVAERSKAPVLKTVPIRIQQTTQTNITANTWPVVRGCFSRLSRAMEFAKNCPEIVRNFSASYSGYSPVSIMAASSTVHFFHLDFSRHYLNLQRH